MVAMDCGFPESRLDRHEIPDRGGSGAVVRVQHGLGIAFRLSERT
jgi:hypothetical protein